MALMEEWAAAALGVALKEAQAVLHQRMDEELRPLGLTVPQFASLQALQDTPGITGSELARRAFVTRQSMNVLLQGLERRGLIERSDVPGPRRERATTVTPDAEALLAAGRIRVDAVTARMTRELTEQQQRQLTVMLTACRDALLEEASPPRNAKPGA
ncbi:MAG TPA: MarR family transcriptional regulator [Propioniciclava sp.]|uniref:MarR family winged helix-turn-helix transcriptional regulator n=1 Tax=Propioniciclava sp. TaxID=2038686 RepID=UPI002BE561BC|nr:MarR family transcriptional regulator [Propioniciclava sp.]HRL79844.1 MarR family transcriptional regulator [Propioniciclava sp.]